MPTTVTTAPCASKALSCQQLGKVLGDFARVMVCPASTQWRADSFRATANEPMTLRRAKALKAVLDRCLLPAVPGELLIGVGNIGRRLPSDPIVEAALEADQRYLRESIGARHFAVHSDHHAPDYAKLLRLGFGGLKAEVASSLPRQDETGRLFLASVQVALEGASSHMRRWSRHLKTIAPEHPDHQDRLLQQALMMDRLAEAPASTFTEALQLTLSYHYMMQLDGREAMAFGRMDQYLHPYYLSDLAAKRITDDEVQALFDHLFAKITVDGDVQNIALGGVKPADGSDATNELSFMILEACKRVGRAGGNCTARIHKNTPSAFLEKCAEVIRTGIGYPAVFNDEIEIPALVRQGYTLEDARDYCFVGCIEVFIQGKQAPWADSRLNPAHSLNLALFNGKDTLTGEQAGPATGEPTDFESFFKAFVTQLEVNLDKHITDWNNTQAHYDTQAMNFTSPLMSALVADCIARGRDMNDGGACYPGNCGFGVMGLAVVADSLAVLKQLVFEEKRFTLDQLRAMLLANFEGYEKERQLILRGVPKFGNDDDRVDALAVRYVHEYATRFDRYRTPQGGHYWSLLGSNISNIWGGSQVGATPDGRLSRTPLSDAASPYFGRDMKGPTSSVKSVAKIPYELCLGGNVVNMKLHPSAIQGPQGLKALTSLIRTCFDLGGSELQFNTTDRAVLEEAMNRPEAYENLVVRVSGFSANFIWLEKAVQKDILARTEHALFGSH
jgi:pyruvate-formate lyase